MNITQPIHLEFEKSLLSELLITTPKKSFFSELFIMTLIFSLKLLIIPQKSLLSDLLITTHKKSFVKVTY